MTCRFHSLLCLSSIDGMRRHSVPRFHWAAHCSQLCSVARLLPLWPSCHLAELVWSPLFSLPIWRHLSRLPGSLLQ